ncbi:transposase [Roseofilum sp. BLCC_M154]|uniref:Transposase n=1 Tax=Roseofilum acuticapitatum BLCC-M154 TaxID=3022444 RepID=A0ABT7ASY8_9CYAN|nr:transposase [Roseofilum acuticapitatum]MDJ1170022.1 transposase [Roseofilum acuticapitatum BLCC-M154]
MQYTRNLLFSQVVNLMSLVVCGIQPSVNAAYRRQQKELSISRTALYNKLNGIETQVSEALLRANSLQLSACIDQMGGALPEWVSGYRVRILDGNCLATTDHRLKALRSYAAKPLPGKSLVVIDPARQLVRDVFLCADGHAQERSLFEAVLKRVEPRELWLADRNMGTKHFLFGLAEAGAAFVIRQHRTPSWLGLNELKFQGMSETGPVFEQLIRMDYQGQTQDWRRVVLRLKKTTRDGDQEIAIVTNLPSIDADAMDIAHLYRQRWSIETLFQVVTENFEGEIQTLGYPPAALFSFVMALVAYNILATVKAAVRVTHGAGAVEETFSWYYLVEEVQSTHRGMMIAIDPQYWQSWQSISLDSLACQLLELAGRINLKRFLKQARGPKKKKPPLIVDRRHRHLSTQRLLH